MEGRAQPSTIFAETAARRICVRVPFVRWEPARQVVHFPDRPVGELEDLQLPGISADRASVLKPEA